ncbi:TetR family transcriptional regulator [Corynebacterium senegalense]|uniref:TetR family transcriptional regulator n=1 Tax=Corynebacterium senegalense TaxID=2080750 RepID=UPI000E20123C|nr:TetR family transcriptional regulator [Corynebacterium senegalense]
MKGLSTEQMLAVADEVCAIHKVRVRSFAALAACAAVPGARVHGAPVFDSAEAAATELSRAVAALRPLTGANDALAEVAGAVYRDWAEVG